MNRSFRRTGIGAQGTKADPKPRIFNLGFGAFGFALVTQSLGCSTPPPPPKVIPKPPVVVAVPPPPPPLPPAKWMQVAGATTVGPQIDGGTMMLVGGRRVVVAADGSSKAETAPSPEPLQQVVVVPTSGGTKRIIGRGKNGIYRLDDPLGAPKPLAQSESEIRAIASYSGLIALWTYNSDTPRFVDVETGKFKVVTTLPPLPMRTVAFRNDKEGAAIFEGVGVAVTSDGGATWKRVTEDVGGDALRMQGISILEGSLFAYVFEEGFLSPIDATKANLGRAMERAAETNSPALVRWIRATGVDPIAAAASGGVESIDGTALVASNGLIARVDLKTGTIKAIEEFAREVNNGTCTFQRAGNAGWLACPIAEQPNTDIYDPFGIMRVPLDGPNFKPERPAIVRSGEVELRTSPSGGVMFMGQCNGDGEGEICARQPDGRWINLAAEVELSSRGVGPLGDGRVAFLRNMWDGDKPETHVAGDEPDEEEEARPQESDDMGEDREDRIVPEGKRLYIATVGESHKEQRIATLAWRPRGDLRIHSPIQEDSEHNLHLIVGDDEGVYSVVQPIDKEARAPQRLEGITEARLRGSRGVALGSEGVRATTDGGRTWASVPLPTAAHDALTQIDSMASDPSMFGVSEVGVLMDRSVRIGWGTTDTIDDPVEPVFDSILPSVSRVSAAEKLLTCTEDAASVQGTPVLTSTGLIAAALGKKTPAPKGTRRASTTGSSSRDSVMGTLVYFDEEGPDKPGVLPNKWTFNWIDPTEVGGKMRTFTGAPPKDSPWGAQIRNVAGSGARALFTIRVGVKNVLVRTKASGGAEMIDVPSDLLPSNDVVFGTEKGEPIAWTRDNSLIVWISGETPRVIGQLSYRSSRLLGEPTKDGIPVLVNGQDWSALRTFPIPALGKKDAPAPAALAPTLDGWSAAPNLPNHIGRYGVCTAKPKAGQQFVFTRSYARATVDGATGSLGYTRYRVFVNGGDVCVAGVSATYSADRSSRPQTPTPANAPKKALVSFLRADFLAKRSEGGTRGLPAKDAMNKLTCTLEERK